MTRPGLLLVAVAALHLAAGCRTSGLVTVQKYAPRPVDDVDVIGLRVTQGKPVNWDEKPGADGLQVQVNFFRRGEDLSVTVRGTLELSLYEGRLKPGQIAAARPLRSWRFEGVELPTYCRKTPFGWGYAMRLPWGATPPSGANVTVGSRYVSPDGRVVTRRPIIIPLVPQ